MASVVGDLELAQWFRANRGQIAETATVSFT